MKLCPVAGYNRIEISIQCAVTFADKNVIYAPELEILTGDIEIERWADHIDKILELIEGFNAGLFRIARRWCREKVRRHL